MESHDRKLNMVRPIYLSFSNAHSFFCARNSIQYLILIKLLHIWPNLTVFHPQGSVKRVHTDLHNCWNPLSWERRRPEAAALLCLLLPRPRHLDLLQRRHVRQGQEVSERPEQHPQGGEHVHPDAGGDLRLLAALHPALPTRRHRLGQLLPADRTPRGRLHIQLDKGEWSPKKQYHRSHFLWLV